MCAPAEIEPERKILFDSVCFRMRKFAFFKREITALLNSGGFCRRLVKPESKFSLRNAQFDRNNRQFKRKWGIYLNKNVTLKINPLLLIYYYYY